MAALCRHAQANFESATLASKPEMLQWVHATYIHSNTPLLTRQVMSGTAQKAQEAVRKNAESQKVKKWFTLCKGPEYATWKCDEKYAALLRVSGIKTATELVVCLHRS